MDRKRRNAEIISLFTGTRESAQELAAKFSLSAEGVLGILRRNGVYIRCSRSSLKKRNEAIIEAIQKGFSPEAIGEEFKITAKQVYEVVRSFGSREMISEARKNRTRVRNASIREEFFSKGTSVEDICSLFNVKEYLVRKLIKPEKIPLSLFRKSDLFEATFQTRLEAVKVILEGNVIPPCKKDEYKRLLELVSKGFSIGQIKEALNRSYPWIRNALKTLGVRCVRKERESLGGPTLSQRKRNDEIIAAYLSGECQVNIARRYGISRARVGQIIHSRYGGDLTFICCVCKKSFVPRGNIFRVIEGKKSTVCGKCREKMPLKPREKANCEFCGKSFEKKTKGRRFCSRKCSLEYLIAERHSKIDPPYRDDRIRELLKSGIDPREIAKMFNVSRETVYKVKGVRERKGSSRGKFFVARGRDF